MSAGPSGCRQGVLYTSPGVSRTRYCRHGRGVVGMDVVSSGESWRRRESRGVVGGA